MSLFDELKRLFRRDKFQMEDFHTEIVAQVLRNSEPLTMEWLCSLRATTLEMPNSIKIRTQETFAALEQDQPGSRVDMVIRLIKDGQGEMIFIESKIDSTENPGQLEKYSGTIAKQEGFDKTRIIYITRDFQMPRPAPVISTRWSDFYQHLKAHVNSDGLANELKLFMEKNRMSQRNQFTAIDSLALGNFLAAKSLMDDTLWSGVHAEFEKILGKVSSRRQAVTQLSEHDQYIIYAEFGNDLGCLLGYWLPNDEPTKVASIGLTLQSNPKSSIRKKVVSAFRDFASKTGNGWQEDELDDEKAWGGIYKRRELHTFMAQPDHVKAIKDYLLSLLEEVKRFKKSHPELPWSANVIEADEEDS
jgi:hypothetical protein